jgi:hypothetical protein
MSNQGMIHLVVSESPTIHTPPLHTTDSASLRLTDRQTPLRRGTRSETRRTPSQFPTAGPDESPRQGRGRCTRDSAQSRSTGDQRLSRLRSFGTHHDGEVLSRLDRVEVRMKMEGRCAEAIGLLSPSPASDGVTMRGEEDNVGWSWMG